MAAFLVAAALIEAYWSELGSKAGVLAPMLTLSVVLGLVGVVVNAVAVKRGRTPRRRAWLGLVASAVSPLSVGVVSLFLWWLFSQDWSFQ